MGYVTTPALSTAVPWAGVDTFVMVSVLPSASEHKVTKFGVTLAVLTSVELCGVTCVGAVLVLPLTPAQAVTAGQIDAWLTGEPSLFSTTLVLTLTV